VGVGVGVFAPNSIKIDTLATSRGLPGVWDGLGVCNDLTMARPRHLREVCCSVLQCVAVCCSVRHAILLGICSVLQCVAACCSVLQCVSVCKDLTMARPRHLCVCERERANAKARRCVGECAYERAGKKERARE